jgi:hypothetical protein
MNMSEHGKERVQLYIILKNQPVFFIRWGLVVFVVMVFVLFLFTYYVAYDITWGSLGLS